MTKGVRRLFVISCVLVAALVCPTSQPALMPVGATSPSTYEVVHEFENPPRNPATLLRGSDGALYGATTSGQPGSDDQTQGAATLFKINEDGSGFRKLHDDSEFRNGVQLVKGPGARRARERYSGSVRTVRDSVCCTCLAGDTARSRVAGLIEGSNGALYGTTQATREAEGHGTIWYPVPSVPIRKTPPDAGKRSENPDGLPTTATWVLKTTITRPSDGRVWSADTRIKIVFSGNGEFRVDRFEIAVNCRPDGGSTTQTASTQRRRVARTEQLMTAPAATSDGFGTIFRINEDGTGFQKLHDFDRVGGAFPSGLILASDGAFYGTAEVGGAGGGGVLFRFIPGL